MGVRCQQYRDMLFLRPAIPVIVRALSVNSSVVMAGMVVEEEVSGYLYTRTY